MFPRMFFGTRKRVVRGDANDAECSVGMEIANLEIGHESSSRLFGNLFENDLNVAPRRFMCGHIGANMMEVARISPQFACKSSFDIQAS